MHLIFLTPDTYKQRLNCPKVPLFQNAESKKTNPAKPELKIED
jgi:hypothetical protein